MPKRPILERGYETTPVTLFVEFELKAISGTFSYKGVFRGSAETGMGIASDRRPHIYLVFFDYVGGTGFKTISTLGTTGNPVLDINKKYTIALTYNGDKLDINNTKLYINGELTPQAPTNTVTSAMEFYTTASLRMQINSTSVGLDFAFTRATAWDIKLSPEDIASCNFDCNETDKVIDILATQGNGATIHNLLETGNNGTVTNATLSDVWGTPSDVLTPHNEYRGFSLYQNNSTPTLFIRVPYKNDGTPNTQTISGYTFVSNHPAGEHFNNSESKFRFDDVATDSDIFESDTDRVFFDTDGSYKWFDINDCLVDDGSDRINNAGFWYINKLSNNAKKQFTIYKTDKVNQQDVKVLKFHKMGSFLTGEFDHNYHARLS